MKTGDAKKGRKKGKKKRLSDGKRMEQGKEGWAEVSTVPYTNKLTTLLHLNGYSSSYISTILILSIKYGFAQHCKPHHSMCKNIKNKETPVVPRPTFFGCTFPHF